MVGSGRLSILYEKAWDILLSKIGFWAGEIYDVSSATSLHGSVLDSISGNKKWILIVAREHYHESVAEYPIGDARDLRAFLRLDSRLTPYRGIQFDDIERLSAESHRVTSWVVNESVLASLPFRPLLLIPETACFSYFPGGGLFSAMRREDRVLVAVSKNGLKSGVEPLGLTRAAFLRWRSQFIADSEWGDDAPVAELSREQTGSRYLRGIWEILLKAPLAFTLPIARTDRSDYPFVKFFRVSVAISFLYLLLTSSFLVASSSWIDFKLGRNAEKSEVALSEFRGGRALEERLGEINRLFKAQPANWVVWDLTLDLVKRGANITRVDGRAGEVTIYGTAVKATDVLRFLNEDNRVTTAEFRSQVRQVEGRQQFGVSVVLAALNSGTGTQGPKPRVAEGVK